MRNQPRKTLAVIGAGPKGIAIAVKAKVLEEFGFPVDRVVLIEKNNVAAHWSGEFGYTNGEMKLGTSPEKDVVFPLETDVGDPVLNQRVRQRLLQFTWISFLVDTAQYSDWVDRGRPAPCHLFWADYLRWVSVQLGPQISIVTGHVIEADLNSQGNQWELKLKDSKPSIFADRLMLTGPGQTRLNFIRDTSKTLPPQCYDLESFWSAIKNKTLNPVGKLAVIGAGENAASALLALSQYAVNMPVDVISPKGFISTRAESFYENQIYSQPDRNRWMTLDPKDRIDFIERTDLGVFSVHAMSLLNEQARHQIIPGRVTDLTTTLQGLEIQIEYAGQKTQRQYDHVVIASGFDQTATLKKLLSPRALRRVELALGEELTTSNLMASIERDLSVKNVTPSLHLPMLAGLSQGPGFANLSCLGRLSDRVVIPAEKIVSQSVRIVEQAL
ncbi:MAG: SidA/IucD/PvdA family monooxygenase [Bdellovibrionaceae bacterium]|nr:SidA/IucD/PvdA family monooxygenase [Pseudobdellovibrionaceae bacterium]